MKKFLVLGLIISYIFGATYVIDFKGNKTFDKERLYKELGFEKSFWQIIAFKKLKPKVEEKLLPSLKEELELFYKQEGFYKSKIELKKIGKKAVFEIKENNPIIVKKIEITSDFDIEKYIYLKENDRFSASLFIKSKEDIKNALLKKGYCSYEFNPKAYIFIEKEEAYLVYFLEKGKICKIKDIKIFSNKTIKDDVILSHIYLNKNDNFSLQKIEASYRRLYALEYFNSVRFDYSKKIDNKILLDIYVKERKKKNIYKAAIGYESLNGFHTNFSWKNINIHQKQVKFDIFYSKNKKEASIELFIPTIKILSKSYDLTADLSYKKEIFENFSQKETKLGANFINDLYNISYSIGFFLENSKIYDTKDCYKEEKFLSFYPLFKFILDQRDNKLSPKKGFFIKSLVEGSIKALSKASYVKNLNEVGFYLSFNDLIIFLKGKIGFIDVEKGDIPPSKLFFAGGINSNRAYSYNKLLITKNGCKYGANSILETTVELSYPIYKNIKGAIFWDRTVLSQKKLNFFQKPTNGIGIGIRYPSIIGDIKFDIGFDTKNFSQNAFHLSIGAAF